MRDGAFHFFEKPFNEQQLLDAVHDAFKHDEDAAELEAGYESLATCMAQLTKREHEVAERVVAGQASKVIAIDLGISERTVEVHRRAIMQKTASPSLADLVKKFVMWQRGQASST